MQRRGSSSAPRAPAATAAATTGPPAVAHPVLAPPVSPPAPPAPAAPVPPTPAAPAPPALPGAPGADRCPGCLFSDDFSSADGSAWQVTSGRFLRASGVGRSAGAVFRMPTVPRDFGDTELRPRVRHLGHTGAGPATDGIHVFVRYLSQYELYVVSLNRRDHRLVVKKKVPGGPFNGGTYHELGAVPYRVPYGRWQDFSLTTRGRDDGVRITVAQDGRALLTVRDRGAGGPPLRSPGAVGLRSDNVSFEVDDFQARPASPLPPVSRAVS